MENKKKSAKVFNIFLYIIAAILFATGFTILIRENLYIKTDETQGLVSEEEKDSVHETYKPKSTPVSDYEIIPVKFHFIDLGASCDIYPVGLSDDNSMETLDSAKDVSWLSEYPYVVPGDAGNAVIAGHNRWKGEKGTFSLLKELEIGDKVAVTFDTGFSRYFEVVSIDDTVRYDDQSPMKAHGVDEPVLTLITCLGDWSSRLDQSKHRVVVVCKPVEADS